MLKKKIYILEVFVLDTILFLTGLYLFMYTTTYAQKIDKKPAPIIVSNSGKLTYDPDSLGNSIFDFSHAGYAGGNEPIPDVPVKAVVPTADGDATARIQSAIDYVGSLPINAKGIRGAVLLEKGIHTILGSLVIKHSGVKIRGNGIIMAEQFYDIENATRLELHTAYIRQCLGNSRITIV